MGILWFSFLCNLAISTCCLRMVPGLFFVEVFWLARIISSCLRAKVIVARSGGP